MPKFTLYSPRGERYETNSRVEATRLKAHGYTERAPKKSEAPAPAKKTAAKKTAAASRKPRTAPKKADDK